ncbi:MAG: PadR family transcriptional regulator [Solirubrobacterales bacterium]
MTAMELSATAYVILGMVSREPRSGYEIKALVDNTTRFFWAASYGQIYPELKRLSKAGLIAGVDSPHGERKRAVYEITADGEEKLKSWLRQPPTTCEMREEGLLKLFFAGVLPAPEAAEILRAMRRHRTGMVEQLRSLEPIALAKEDRFPLMVLQGGIEFNEWFADWCERMERQILEPDGKDRSTSGIIRKGAADV